MNGPEPVDDTQLRLCLRDVLHGHGAAGLDDSGLLSTLLPDLLAGYEREMRLIIAAASINVAELLGQRTAQGMSATMAVRDVTALLAQHSMYEASLCRQVVTAYAVALDLSVDEPPAAGPADAVRPPARVGVEPSTVEAANAAAQPPSPPVQAAKAAAQPPSPPVQAAKAAAQPANPPVQAAKAPAAPVKGAVPPAKAAAPPGDGTPRRPGPRPAPATASPQGGTPKVILPPTPPVAAKPAPTLVARGSARPRPKPTVPEPLAVARTRVQRRYVVGGAGAVAALVATLLVVDALDHRAEPTSPNGPGTPVSNLATCDYALAFFGPTRASASTTDKYIALEQGAQLAVDKFNHAHPSGCVQLVPFDPHVKGNTPAALAGQIVANTKILGVVGPTYSDESAAADPALDAAGVPVVTPEATSPNLTGRWTVFHRAIATDEDAADAAATYIRQTLGATAVCVVQDASARARTYAAPIAAEAARALGRLVVDTRTVADKPAYLIADAAAEVQASGASVVFFAGYDTVGGQLLNQLRTRGWRGTLVGDDAMMTTTFVKTAGAAGAEGTVVMGTDPPVNATTPAALAFRADYRAAYGSDPPPGSNVAYDVANMYLQGIAAEKTTRPAMLDWINGYDDGGAARHYRFAANGELVPPDALVWTYKVTGGAFLPPPP